MTRPADARLAAMLGARYVGVVFAESPRRCTPDAARDVFEGVRFYDVRRVGVFGDDDPARILAVAEQMPLDVVQLHGDDAAGLVAAVRPHFAGEVWVAARVGPLGLAPGQEALFGAADGVVLDTRSPGALGGTGEAWDWAVLADRLEGLRGGTRVIVAGGLRPDNVAAAIGRLAPDVVDVSSGIEAAPGIKDPERMRAFLAAVAAAGSR